MYRLLETVFHYPFRLLTLLLLCPAIGAGIAYFMVPHSYQAVARLWAYQRFGVITATGTDSNLYETPAQTQATALTELLNTRDFALSVTHGIDIAPTLGLSASVRSDPQKLDNAIAADITKNVVVTTLDYSLYTITYTNRSAEVAQKVVAAVVTQFNLQGIQFAYGDSKHLLQIDQQQLVQAQQKAAQDLQTEQNYLKQHSELSQPGVSPMNDPQYAALDAQRQQDQAAVQNIQLNINILTQQISATGTNLASFFKELDPPLLPAQPQSRTKQFLVAGGVGLGVAILACLIFLLILVRRDRAIYIHRDLERLADLPVVMEIPQLPTKIMKALAERSA